VLQQRLACQGWPRSTLPADCGEAVGVETPTLILTGNVDPVTGPTLGVETARSLPKALHVIYPGGHGPGRAQAACLQELVGAFLDAGTVVDLDTSCVGRIQPEAFALPARRQR
jgi:pimeloyl-ACP methyl ester carboxylesterase